MRKSSPDVKATPTRLRCAIYTRKSTEEGLEQDFNTLDAQREAAEAFIQSQRREGWIVLTERYDDGGFIRLDGLIREQTLPNYSAVARRGRVTRARISQIMKLLHLAPDLQEQMLFLSPNSRLTERHLRPIVRQIDWHEQRRLFRELTRAVGPEPSH